MVARTARRTERPRRSGSWASDPESDGVEPAFTGLGRLEFLESAATGQVEFPADADYEFLLNEADSTYSIRLCVPVSVRPSSRARRKAAYR